VNGLVPKASVSTTVYNSSMIRGSVRLVRVTLGEVLFASAFAGMCSGGRPVAPTSTMGCDTQALSACGEVRQLSADLLDKATTCNTDEDCKLVDRIELGASVSPCAQNPTSAIFCPFAVRRDADLVTLGQTLSRLAKQGESCVTCAGQPCLIYNCAMPGTRRPVCDPSSHRCRLVPQ
jgi:hypothetical protein